MLLVIHSFRHSKKERVEDSKPIPLFVHHEPNEATDCLNAYFTVFNYTKLCKIIGNYTAGFQHEQTLFLERRPRTVA